MSDIAWQVLMAYGAIISWVFVIGYAYLPKHQRRPGDSWRRQWWLSAAGTNLMLFTASTAVTFTLLFVDAFGPMPRAVWFGVASLIILAVTHRTALLLDDRRKR